MHSLQTLPSFIPLFKPLAITPSQYDPPKVPKLSSFINPIKCTTSNANSNSPSYITPSLKHLLKVAPSPTPPTDRVIDFGRHKGKMLGTLPSKYLKWMSKKLKENPKDYDMQEWADLAKEVLQNPIYKERLEWEVADKIIDEHGYVLDELNDVAVMFGWDIGGKDFWGIVIKNKYLFGTTKGGKIPRKKYRPPRMIEQEVVGRDTKVVSSDRKAKVTGKREQRIERLRMKRSGSGGVKMEALKGLKDSNPLGYIETGKKVGVKDGYDNGGSGSIENGTAEKKAIVFPGREALWKRATAKKKRI